MRVQQTCSPTTSPCPLRWRRRLPAGRAATQARAAQAQWQSSCRMNSTSLVPPHAATATTTVTTMEARISAFITSATRTRMDRARTQRRLANQNMLCFCLTMTHRPALALVRLQSRVVWNQTQGTVTTTATTAHGGSCPALLFETLS